MRICAIIPCFNEEADIGEVVRQTKLFVDTVIVIDNGSTDNTAKEAKANGALVALYKHNQGAGASLYAGYQIAFDHNYDFLVQLDGDGQHKPGYIPKMQIKMLEHNADVIIGSRFANIDRASKVHPVRRIGNKAFSFAVDIMGKSDITDFSSGYRLWKVDSLKCIGFGNLRHWAMEQTLRAQMRGLKIVELPMFMNERVNGQSHLTRRSFIRYPIVTTTLFCKTLVQELRK